MTRRIFILYSLLLNICVRVVVDSPINLRVVFSTVTFSFFHDNTSFPCSYFLGSRVSPVPSQSFHISLYRKSNMMIFFRKNRERIRKRTDDKRCWRGFRERTFNASNDRLEGNSRRYIIFSTTSIYRLDPKCREEMNRQKYRLSPPLLRPLLTAIANWSRNNVYRLALLFVLFTVLIHRAVHTSKTCLTAHYIDSIFL